MNRLKEYSAVFTFLVVLIGIIISAYINIDTRNINLQNSRIVEYQKLMGDFPRCGLLDTQVSIVYELRNFPEHYELTKEILSAWLKREDIYQHKRLVLAMQDTLKYIDNKSKK